MCTAVQDLRVSGLDLDCDDVFLEKFRSVSTRYWAASIAAAVLRSTLFGSSASLSVIQPVFLHPRIAKNRVYRTMRAALAVGPQRTRATVTRC